MKQLTWITWFTTQIAVVFTISVSTTFGTPWDWQQSSESTNSFSALELHLRDLKRQPYFLKVHSVVSAKRGETAYLPCRVKSLGDYLVTWMKGDDVTVLSVGSNTFSSDTRYSIVHVPRGRIDADDWNLLINRTQLSDSGQYFCSLNTEPKISHTVFLTIQEPDDGFYEAQADSPIQFSSPSTPQSHITGAPSMLAATGDNVQLDCRISGLKTTPSSLYWTKDGTVLNARVRSGISLEVEKLPGVSRSTLFLSHASKKDSGSYACMSDVALPANISLFVTEGLNVSPVLASLSSTSYIPVPFPGLSFGLAIVLVVYNALQF